MPRKSTDADASAVSKSSSKDKVKSSSSSSKTAAKAPPPKESSTHGSSTHSGSARGGSVRGGNGTGGASARSKVKSKATSPRDNNNKNRLNESKHSDDFGTADYEEDHPDLAELEHRLNEDVDDDFFVDPRKFHTLHRVIDVLGMQLADEMGSVADHQQQQHTKAEAHSQLGRNPAYRALKQQQATVEEAIEHLALIHCADLNGSVVQVGRVARQFHDAVSKVRSIRKQVREIQETLGASQAPTPQQLQAAQQIQAQLNKLNPNQSQQQQGEGGAVVNAAAATSAASAMSLRELWLKKLECEAVLSLLEKLDRIRAAPMQFDLQLQHTRIGAAVIGLAQALDTMFSDDVAQVQALHKIMEQLMLRKQTAEELVWEFLVDVLFLRTGNGLAYILATTKPGRKLPLSLASKQILSTASIKTGTTDKNSGNGANNNNNNNNSGPNANNASKDISNVNSNGSVVSSESKPTHQLQKSQVASQLYADAFAESHDATSMMKNPFFNERMRFALDRDLELDQGNYLDEDDNDADFNDDAMDEDELEDDGGTGPGGAAPHKPPPSTTSGLVALNNTTAKVGAGAGTTGNLSNTTSSQAKRMVIPLSMLEAEFDLEADERRCLEEIQLICGTTIRKKSKIFKASGEMESSGAPGNNAHHRSSMKRQSFVGDNSNSNSAAANMPRPHYADHVLALRTLVECLARLKRLDDMERILTDVLEHELSTLRQREQGRTFCRLEAGKKLSKRGTGKVSRSVILYAGADGNSATDLTEFRRHLQGLLSAFGCVMVRLTHLSQILRHRLQSEKTKFSAHAVPSNALQSVLSAARSIMERELTIFIKSCLKESDASQEPTAANQGANRYTSYTSRWGIGNGMTTFSKNANANVAAPNKYETGLFSLGILNDPTSDRDNGNDPKTLTAGASRTTTMEMKSPKFVIDVLFPKTTNASGSASGPQIRHALFFRKSLAKWAATHEQLRKELSIVTGEDTSMPSYNEVYQEPALKYLDTVIQKDLLPMLQEEAVNGTVKALERQDAFDPVLDRNVYARSNSNEPQDVDMCKACNALYSSTAPLFLALHRLPRGGDMYLPLVAVLEHVVLTFISRIKQQVGRICNDKTALQLLMDGTGGGGSKVSSSFGQLMERRKAFAQLLLAYADGDLLDVSEETAAASGSMLTPLTPPPVDTPNKSGADGAKSGAPQAAGGGLDMDLLGGVEKEESQLTMELAYVKPFLEFARKEQDRACGIVTVCTDGELMKAACLAHSLLKLASLLDSRLKIRSMTHGGGVGVGGVAAAAFGGGGSTTKILPSTRALREAIKTIQANGLKLAKFCRADILMQS
jgi:hypothetical protein